jgi:hypothetical protein
VDIILPLKDTLCNPIASASSERLQEIFSIGMEDTPQFAAGLFI